MSAGVGTVSVEPFRDAFERSGRRAVDVARDLEWYTPKGKRHRDRERLAPDGSRVRRVLGLVPYSDGSGAIRVRASVTYGMALKLTKALDLDPVDAGL